MGAPGFCGSPFRLHCVGLKLNNPNTVNSSAPSSELSTALQFIRENVGYRWLTQSKVLQVTGSDQREWLSRMLTQHCANLKEGDSCYTAAVSVKGKLFGTMYLHARSLKIGESAESVPVSWLVIPSQTAADFVAHLDKHIIMEEVELALLEDRSVLTLQGPKAATLATALVQQFSDCVGPLPAKRLAPALGEGLDLLVSSTSVAAVQTWLAQESASHRALELTDARWDVLRLEAGVPEFMRDFSVENYVQEADITAQTVSFNKGCYIGQEVVCRLEMRGHVRRQLVHVLLDGDESSVPSAGQVLDDDAGVMTSAAFSPTNNKIVAFAMVKWDLAKEKKPLSLAGRALSFATGSK